MIYVGYEGSDYWKKNWLLRFWISFKFLKRCYVFVYVLFVVRIDFEYFEGVVML